MTGVYPFRMGLQRGFGKRSPQVSPSLVVQVEIVIFYRSQGIPLNFTLLSELLRKAGYSTHGFGKVLYKIIQVLLHVFPESSLLQTM